MQDTRRISTSRSPRRAIRFVCQAIEYIYILNKCLIIITESYTSLNRFPTYHLSHTETVAEIVERHQVIMLVHFIQPFAQHWQWDLELLDESAVDEHCLHQMQHRFVAPFVRIERWQSEGSLYLVGQRLIADLQEAHLHLFVVGQTGFAMRRTHRTISETCRLVREDFTNVCVKNECDFLVEILIGEGNLVVISPIKEIC